MEKKRIEWVDIAKCIGIILMIVAHSMPGAVSAIIFTFHMPLFFILSGYTTKIPDSVNGIVRIIYHMLVKMILPTIIVYELWPILFSAVTNHSILNMQQLASYFVNSLQPLLWASGVAINGHPALGVLWFPFTLFWARIIFVTIFSFMNERLAYVCAVVCSAIGLLLQRTPLPQNLDVAFVAVFFIMIGHLFRERQDNIYIHRKLILIICMAYWIICAYLRITITMTRRQYPYGYISLIEAVCGSLVIIAISIEIEKMMIISKVMAYMGKATLISLLIHHCCWGLSSYLGQPGDIAFALKRVFINLMITTLLYWFINKVFHKKSANLSSR